jgi:hypothetical protein
MGPGPKLDDALAAVAAGAAESGRDPSAIGMEGRVNWKGDVDLLVEHIEGWRAAGASHLSINTMGAGLGGVDGHLAVLAEAAAALGI